MHAQIHPPIEAPALELIEGTQPRPNRRSWMPYLVVGVFFGYLVLTALIGGVLAG